MAVDSIDLALCGLTVLGAVALLSVFTVGLAGLETTGGLTALLAALAVLGAVLVEPYRRAGH